MAAQRIFILGGARSGKSDYAERLAADMGRHVLYIATAEAHDEEMATRIIAHRRARPATWRTLEAPRRVAEALITLTEYPDLLLLDCLTLLVSNMVLDLEGEPPSTIEAAIQAEVEAILTTQAKLAVPLIAVSNEVGLGVVPPYPLGRLYRDILGRINQHVAAQADQVLFMVAGLPMVVKNEGVGIPGRLDRESS